MEKIIKACTRVVHPNKLSFTASAMMPSLSSAAWFKGFGVISPKRVLHPNTELLFGEARDFAVGFYHFAPSQKKAAAVTSVT